MILSNGLVKWSCQMVLSNGLVKWSCQNSFYYIFIELKYNNREPILKLKYTQFF